jgi:predicted lipoprotein with Yx(FWY)xxD motif
MRGIARRTRGAAAVALLAFAGVAGFLVAGNPASGATQSKATVSLRATKLGKVLVSSSGRTLYLFMKDKSGRSSCSGTCAKYWPPLISAAKPTAGAGIKASLLGRTKRSDGRWQVTYNKHPLYWFALDKKAGDVAGENLDDFGGEWYVVSAKGAKVEPNEDHSTTTESTTTSTGYSYTAPSPPPGY